MDRTLSRQNLAAIVNKRFDKIGPVPKCQRRQLPKKAVQAASNIGCILLTCSTSRLSTGQLLAGHRLRNMQCFDQVSKSRPCLARVQKQCSRPRLAQVPEGWRRCKQTSAMQIWRAQSRAESADRIKPGKKISWRQVPMRERRRHSIGTDELLYGARPA